MPTPPAEPVHGKRQRKGNARYNGDPGHIQNLLNKAKARRKYEGMVFLLVSFELDASRGLQFYCLA
jgi:hypothetical protein